MKDIYKTIASPAEGEYKEKGSKFFAVAAPVVDKMTATEVIEGQQEKHPKSRHVCYAYRIGKGGLLFRAYDDGEPSSTAGKPILGQIDSFGLTNVVVVVTRYFGGTKLGVFGLINAYRNAAKDALSQAHCIKKYWKDTWQISFGYLVMNEVMSYLKKENFKILDQNFELSCDMKVQTRQKDSAAFQKEMNRHDGLEIELLKSDE